jgi:hypothetical protein
MFGDPKEGGLEVSWLKGWRLLFRRSGDLQEIDLETSRYR